MRLVGSLILTLATPSGERNSGRLCSQVVNVLGPPPNLRLCQPTSATPGLRKATGLKVGASNGCNRAMATF